MSVGVERDEATFLLRGFICTWCRRKSHLFNCWHTQVCVCGSGTKTGLLLLGDLWKDVKTEQRHPRHDSYGALQNSAYCRNPRCWSELVLDLQINNYWEWSFLFLPSSFQIFYQWGHRITEHSIKSSVSPDFMFLYSLLAYNILKKY